MSPQSVESAANVSREALEEYVQFQQSRRQAILQQRPLPSTPEIDPSSAQRPELTYFRCR
ncbi:hypothetical protein F441_09754 [Phytophthora nicotianae CJ01A1]|uniref:Uncharacterized protein n=1 Tax=Phytophthora nicotianae CJ01A1 TaxID=1317063 RepID=W2WYB3_PHYNI|nr:hypothetical protein F441_09754 [Phytophthora nicotianae CJ01A1]